jgi:hypothetical protein
LKLITCKDSKGHTRDNPFFKVHRWTSQELSSPPLEKKSKYIPEIIFSFKSNDGSLLSLPLLSIPLVTSCCRRAADVMEPVGIKLIPTYMLMDTAAVQGLGFRV